MDCVVQADDSAGTKLTGSVINAIIFVAIVAAMTCVLVLLFKYGVRSAVPSCMPTFMYAELPHSLQLTHAMSLLQCTKFIYAYMGLSGFRWAILHDALFAHASNRVCPGPAALRSQGVSQPPCCLACSIYFMLSGIIILQLLHKFQIHVDWITFSFVLYNFSVRRGNSTGAAACCK